MSFKALVVDDSVSACELVSGVLGANGFDVVTCFNGIDAMKYLKEDQFDVVLCDRDMPEVDGVGICYWLRNSVGNKLLPFLMVTGDGRQESLERCFNAGADDFISKPFVHAELVARARAAANRKRITDQLDSAESMLFTLARMVEAKDKCTGDHCGRLSYMAKLFGQYLRLDNEQILALSRSGMLHDIGKLGIPDSILLKPGKLTDDEMAVMRTHSAIGYQLCAGLKSLKATLPIIRHHHERWDGTGYPDKLTGENIPLLARVFQILDIYDALRSERPYKEAYSKKESIAILEVEAKKGRLDYHLVRQFVELMSVSTTDIVSVLVEKDMGYDAYIEIQSLEPMY